MPSPLSRSLFISLVLYIHITAPLSRRLFISRVFYTQLCLHQDTHTLSLLLIHTHTNIHTLHMHTIELAHAHARTHTHTHTHTHTLSSSREVELWAVRCSVLQLCCSATQLQRTATHCNTVPIRVVSSLYFACVCCCME